MFGERYFATRQKLATLVHDVRALARLVGVELEGVAEESEVLQGLQNPFLFVVCGEVNAGKSTLINGLFGEELCTVNVLPETKRVLWYRYGESARDDCVTEVLEERYRPIDFLSDFNIVDTPGTNSVIHGHQAITERFIPVADLILFVFPVSNPWGAATWDFISTIPEELRGKIAFVLQQKDLRDEEELTIIIEHMRQLARQKLGESHDVFAVSGKQAMQSKERRPFEQRLWRSSGYPELEAFISKVVTGSPHRRKVLRDVRDATSSALRQLESRLEDSSREADRRLRLLREFENEIDHRRDAYGEEFEQKLVSLGEVLHAEGQLSGEHLRNLVAAWPSVKSLFCRDEAPAEIEESLSHAVEASIGGLAEGEATELERLCARHWEAISPRLREELEIDPPTIEGAGVDRQRARTLFVRRMSRAARQSVVKLKLRGLLEMQLEERRQVLQRFVVGVLLALSVGGGLGAFGIHPFSWISLVVAGVLAVAGLFRSGQTGRRLLKWFEERLDLSKDPFTDMLSLEYREGVREFFQAYGVLFDQVRRELVEAKAAVEPLEREWRELYLQLKAIEQEL